MADAITTSIVKINTTTINIMPNSATYESGNPPSKSETQASGRNVSIVHKVDYSQAFSEISFDIDNTTANIALMDGFLNRSDLTVYLSDPDNELEVTTTGNRIVDRVKHELGSDGKTSYTLRGNPKPLELTN